jgi:transposase
MEAIGIDVSKDHLDVAVLDDHGTVICERRVKNEGKALAKLLTGLRERQMLGDDHLVCLEATGCYGYRAVLGCLDMGLRVWVAHPMDIKLSLGMQRGKNDKVDARRIAKYAQKYPEKAEVIDRNYLHFEEMRKLLASRDFFVRERAKCKGQLNDDVHFLPESTAQVVKKELKRQVASSDRSILALERAPLMNSSKRTKSSKRSAN